VITYWSAVGIAVVLWFATGWYLNERLKAVHQKLDGLSESFNGLRDYLYEIDPQFDDERILGQAEFDSGPAINRLTLAELEKRKRSNGHRILTTNFREGGFRAPNQ
jgi:hypothetical protein